MSRLLKGQWFKSTLVLVAFVTLATASTWPLIQSPTTRLPIGSEEARTVPYLNLWTLAWNVRSLEHGGLFSKQYWDAPIFWPERDALAMSECQPVLGLCAPIYWLTGSSVLCYNLYLWLSLGLNGFVTWLVLQRRGYRGMSSLTAGVAMLMLPMVHWQLGVLQLVPIWAIVWAIDAVEVLIARTASSPHPTKDSTDDSVGPMVSAFDWRSSLRLTLNLAMPVCFAFWISVHQGLLLAVALVLVAVPLCLIYLNRQLLVVGAMSALIVGVFVGPLAWKHHQVNQRHEFKRDKEVVRSLSAEMADYSMTYGRGILSNDAQRRAWFLGVGLTKSVLCIAAIALLFFRPSRWTVFLACVVVCSMLLSFGVNLQLGEFSFWDRIARWMPGLAQVRSVYRFAYLAQVACVLLGVDVLNRLVNALMMDSSRLPKSLSWMGCGGLMLAFALDPLPPKMNLAVLPDANDEWVLKLNELPPGPVLILPIAFEGEVRDYELTTQWMNQLLPSGKPIVNGYSGFFPESFNKLAGELSAVGLSSDVEKQLKLIGVRYVVVQPYYNSTVAENWSGYQLISEPRSAVRIYDLMTAKVEGEQLP